MKRISFIAMFLVLLTACQEELNFNFGKAEVGQKAYVDLVIEVPQGDAVLTRSVDAYESQINSMALVMFEQSTGSKQYVVLKGNDEKGNYVNLLQEVSGTDNGTNGGYRKYSLNAPVPVLSGNFHVYAVANMESVFSPMEHEKALNDLSETEDEFLARTVKTKNAVWNTGGSYLPMSAMHTGEGNNVVAIYPSSAEGSSEPAAENTPIMLKMRRMVAHIEFIFVNGADAAGATDAVKADNPQFTPNTYSVYNLPKESYLIDQTVAKHSANNVTATAALPTNANAVASDFAHSDPITVLGDRSIKFFMLENVKASSKTLASQSDRDKWARDEGDYSENDRNEGNTSITAPENKNFINAPEGSTFVVVSGEYASNSYIGDVTYTIHLGNFSGASTQRSVSSLGNFVANRNEYHTYTITVNGVKSIETETGVKDGDGEGGIVPGAEGTITKTDKGSQFVLDAHYERVMLSFPFDDKCANSSLMIQSPYTPGKELIEYDITPDDADETAALNAADWGWVKFMAPSSSTSFPDYKPANAVDVVTLAAELRDAYNNKVTTAPEGSHFLLQGSTVYVVAYVDEYFYEKVPGTGDAADWRDFTNENNRIMILNPHRQISPDGNSTSYPDYIFQISQRSIKTTYADNGADPAGGTYRPFGIETWNETGTIEFGTPASTSGVNDNNGWQNSKTQMGIGTTSSRARSWQTGVYAHNLGYLESIADNSKASHTYNKSGTMYAYYACLSRNRDENGNGTVEDFELKWYLPAAEQYVTIWLNNDLLHEDTQLFDPSGGALENMTNNINKASNLFTSSASGHRLYWPVEGASYGQVWGGSWSNTANGVRCVRNLMPTSTTNNGENVYSGIPSMPTAIDTENRTIHSVNISTASLRTTAAASYTPRHTEREPDNRLPEYFKYANSDIEINAGSATANDIDYMRTYTSDPCSSYSEEEDKKDLGQWRIPNQRELLLMYSHNVLTLAGDDHVYTSSTFVTNGSNWGKTEPFATRGEGLSLGVSQYSTTEWFIRCVRDSDSSEGSTGGGDSDGDTGNDNM